MTFSGTVTNQTGGTIQLEAALGSSSTEVNFTGTLNNAGSVILTASGGGGGGTTLDATGGTINNNSGGVFSINAGGGGTRTVNGGVVVADLDPHLQPHRLVRVAVGVDRALCLVDPVRQARHLGTRAPLGVVEELPHRGDDRCRPRAN